MTTKMSKTHFNVNFNLDQRARLQKAFGQPRSVRKYSRMPQSKRANTGFDPSGSFKEFISKDVIHPCSRDSLYPHRNTNAKIEDRNERWALETIKTCSNIDQVPKFQQFKQYNFPLRSRNEIDKYREVFLKTDHIAVKVPKTVKSQLNIAIANDSDGHDNANKANKTNDRHSFLKMKGNYGSFSETQIGWAPYKPMHTTNNTSRMKYNILTFDPIQNHYGTSTKMMDRNLYFKQKGFAEYEDLTRTYRINFNKDFHKTLNENKNTFHIYNGIFSNMYDVCHRNGNLSVPFQSGGMKNVSKHKEDSHPNGNGINSNNNNII